MKTAIAFALLLCAVVADAQVDGASYLVIGPNDYADAVEPLVAWKTRKGVPARFVPLDETGSTPEEVQAYIRFAYHNWPVPPEYVLIAAGPSHLTGYQSEDDCFYGDMEGDYLMEIPVGRLPADGLYECSTMVAKCLAYEQVRDTTDLDWLVRGTTVVNEEDTIHLDPYYQEDSRLARDLWLQAGYTVAESLCNMDGDSALDVTLALHDGRSFITYRGLAGVLWNPPFWGFYPDTWKNGFRMPVIVSATCFTVTLAPDEWMLGNACLRYGTTRGLGGAVAFFGTTRGENEISQFRSACYRGFFKAVFEEGLTGLGQATLRGRFRVDSLFRDQERYTEWCLLGDPEMRVWTARPRTVAAAHDPEIDIGQQVFEVVVTAGGEPVEGAQVCVSMDSAVYEADSTDAQGRASLSIRPDHPGEMHVVVTGENLRPYDGACRVRVHGEPFVAYLRHAVNDSPPMGNGDRMPGSGETFKLPVWVWNMGDSTARQVSGTMAAVETLATVLDSVRQFGTIPASDSASTGPDGFMVRIADNCPDGHIMEMHLRCADSAGRSWTSGFRFRVGGPVIESAGVWLMDSTGNANGRLDPRETAEMAVMLENTGFGQAMGTILTLRCSDPMIVLGDSVSVLGTIPAHGFGHNFADPFVISARHMYPGKTVPFTLNVRSVGHQWDFPIVLKVGAVDTCDPIPDGPREPPLYWAYDDLDSAYEQAPVFDWVEIRGIGTRLDLENNRSAQVALPPGFGPFVYYGRAFDTLSVSDNGWLAPGVTACTTWRALHLPTQRLPPLLAVNMWDFDPERGGGVWYFHDALNHRFIVEWDSVHYVLRPEDYNRFQVVIYDTTRSAGRGNCDFVFQYSETNCSTYVLTGIQDPTMTIGIEVALASIRHQAAAPVVPGRAIRFTTDAPPTGLLESEVPGTARRHSELLSAVPNPFNRVVSVRWLVPAPGRASVTVFDISGRLVRILASGPAGVGEQFVCWDGRDRHGRRVQAGVYLLRLDAPGVGACRKLVLTD